MLALACTKVEVYQRLQDSRLDAVYIKTGIDFARYTSVLIDSVSVWYPPGGGPSGAEIATMEQMFRDALAESLKGGYKIVTTPNRHALRLHTEFVDLSSLTPDAAVPEEFRRYKFKTASGHITLVGELRDSRTGELLARAADLGLGEMWVQGGQLDQVSLAVDFRRWAGIFRVWMDEVHGRAQ